MPVNERPNVNFQNNVLPERRLPPGDLTVSQETLQRLQVPDDVLLKPENVTPFLARQYVGLQDVVAWNEIKTREADIPEFLYNESDIRQTQSPVSPDERLMLQSYTQDLLSGDKDKVVVGIQTVKNTPLNQLDNAVNDLLKDPPPAGMGGAPSGQKGAGFDLFDTMFGNEVVKETEEQKKKWNELLAAASAKGNPELINTLLGEKFARGLQQKIGKMLEKYSMQVKGMDALTAQFDLQGGKSGNVAAADLAKFNASFARQSTDTNSLFQMIQKFMGDYERVTGETKNINENISRSLGSIIQNLRS